MVFQNIVGEEGNDRAVIYDDIGKYGSIGCAACDCCVGGSWKELDSMVMAYLHLTSVVSSFCRSDNCAIYVQSLTNHFWILSSSILIKIVASPILLLSSIYLPRRKREWGKVKHVGKGARVGLLGWIRASMTLLDVSIWNPFCILSEM